MDALWLLVSSENLLTLDTIRGWGLSEITLAISFSPLGRPYLVFQVSLGECRCLDNIQHACNSNFNIPSYGVIALFLSMSSKRLESAVPSLYSQIVHLENWILMEFDDKVVAEFKRLFSWSNLGSRSVLSSEFINIDHDKNHYGASPVTANSEEKY